MPELDLLLETRSCPDWERAWWDNRRRKLVDVPLPEPATLSRLLAADRRPVAPARMVQPPLFELGAGVR